MVINKVELKDYVRSKWSGGVTTQIGICPEGSQYGNRDFLWRMSSATVEIDKSTFTALPDYNRIIMVLKGEMELTHNGGEAIALKEFEPHAFDGADNTVSRGRVIDFNLMLRKGSCDGFVHAFKLSSGQSKTVFLEDGDSKHTTLLYAFGTSVSVLIDGASYTLNEGDSLVIDQEADESSPYIAITAEGQGAVIMGDIRKL